VDIDEVRLQMHLLLCFLTSSARGLAHEPRDYGPLRLMDAASRLIEAMEKTGLADGSFIEARKQIEDLKPLATRDKKAFFEALDDLVTQFALDLKTRCKENET